MSPFDFFLFTCTVIFMKTIMAYCLYSMVIFVKEIIHDMTLPKIQFHNFKEFTKDGAIYTPCQANEFGTVWHCERVDGSIRVLRMHGWAVSTIVDAFNEI